MYNLVVPPRVDVPTIEARLQVVDMLTRRGKNVAEIAHILLTEEQYHDLIGNNGPNYKRADTSQKRYQISSTVRKTITKDIETLQKRFRREVTPEVAEEGLSEYLYRIDNMFREALNTVADAIDTRDKLNALKLARDLAQDKAKAVGVDLEVAERGKQAEGFAQGMTTMADLVRLAAASRGDGQPLPAHADIIDQQPLQLEGPRVNMTPEELDIIEQYGGYVDEDETMNQTA